MVWLGSAADPPLQDRFLLGLENLGTNVQTNPPALQKCGLDDFDELHESFDNDKVKGSIKIYMNRRQNIIDLITNYLEIEF